MAKQKDPRLARAGVSGYNKPKRTPNHPKKSHVVVAKEGDKVKTIRFGQQGVSGAGKIQSQIQKKLDENLLKLDTQKTLLKENYLLLTGLIKSNGKDIQGCVERCSRRSKRGLARVRRAYAS